MGYDGTHGDHILGFGSPDEDSQILVQAYNKLTELITANSHDACALRKLLALLVLQQGFILFVVLGNILLVGWRGLGELTSQSQCLKIDHLDHRIITPTHDRIVVNVHARGLGDHQVDAFLQLLLFLTTVYHAEETIRCQK